MEFDTFYFGELVSNTNYVRLTDEEEIDRQNKHLKFLADLNSEGVLLAAGPFEGGGGIVFFDAERFTEEEIQKRLDQDPHLIAGAHHIKLRKWFVPKHTLSFTTALYQKMKFPKEMSDV